MKILILSMLTVVSLQSFANGVGNGGDELRLLFEDGRANATNRLPQLKRCSFPDTVKPEIVNWILQNQYQLAADVQESQHVWITDPQVTCAWTQTEPKFDITLSFTACRNVMDASEAGRLLVHESVHHFGIADESFADEIAYAVYGADLSKVCAPPTADPFDPMSCTGDQVRLEDVLPVLNMNLTAPPIVGRYKIYSRFRYCQKIGGCTDWTVSGNGDGNEQYKNLVWSNGTRVVGNEMSGDLIVLNNTTNISFGLRNPASPDVRVSAESWGLDENGFFNPAEVGSAQYGVPGFGGYQTETYQLEGPWQVYLQTSDQHQWPLQDSILFGQSAITKDCIRSSWQQSGAQQNPNSYSEFQVVLYGRINL